MNEGRKFHVRMELVRRMYSNINERAREAETIQDNLYQGRLKYEDAEKLLGIGACDESIISRLRGEGL